MAATPPPKRGTPPKARPLWTEPSSEAPRPSQNGSVICGACQAINPASNRFCRECGLGLWEPCFRCKAPVEATTKYCGSCGANIFEWVQERLASLDKELAKAQRLAQAYRFAEALALLQPIAAYEDSRLREFAERASQMIETCRAEREAWRARVIAVEKEARQLVAKRDYHGANRLLESVPIVFRVGSIGQLYEEVQSALAEIAALEGDLATLGKGPPTAEAIRKIGRLLTLCPTHGEARRLGTHLAARLVEVAQGRLAQGRYQEVKRVLEQVPEGLQNDELRSIRDRAWELTYLVSELRETPLISESVVSLAGRFRKLAPQDREMAAVCVDLERRFQAHPRSLDQPILLLKPPKASPLGRPVEWLTGVGRLRLDSKLELPVLVDNPGRFAAACGAALQGLVETSSDVNLLRDDESLLGKAARWLTQRPARTAWGLDLGSSGLKAVRLALRGGDEPVVTHCDFVEYDKILSQAASDGQLRTLLEDAVKTWVSRNPSADRICLTLPPRSVVVRQFELPDMPPEMLDTAVENEAMLTMPIPLRELEWRYEVLEQIERPSDQTTWLKVAVLGIKQVVLEEWLAAMRKLGVRVDVIQVDWLALHNFAVYNYFPSRSDLVAENAPAAPPVALFDIGTDVTNLLVCAGDLAWLRSGGLGIDRVTKTLVREFHMTFARAESWKRNPGAGDNTARLAEVVRPMIQDLVNELKTGLEVFEEAHPGRRVERVFLVGGGVRLHGLLRYLWWGESDVTRPAEPDSN